MIKYRKAVKSELKDGFLNGFDRYQETSEVLYVKDKHLKQKEDHFIESWDSQKLNQVVKILRECLDDLGVVYIAQDGNQIVGFANLEGKTYLDRYLNLQYIHVSRKYRNRGIGKELFRLIEEEARARGSKYLYISAHPNLYTQKFYQSMGCRLATMLIPELYEHEPLDIHLEKEL